MRLVHRRAASNVIRAALLLLACGLGAVIWLTVESPPPLAWPVRAPPADALAFFAQGLPSLSTQPDTEQDRERLNGVFNTLEERCVTWPPVCSFLEETGRALTDPRTTAVRFALLNARLAEDLRSAALPFFVDVDVRGGWSPEQGRNVWGVRVRTYLLRRSRLVSVDQEVLPSLWVERLDTREDDEGAIGIKKGGMPYSLILLHQLRKQWYQTVLPTLIGHAQDAHARRLYRRHQAALRQEMLQAFSGLKTPSGTAADQMLARMIACMEPTLPQEGLDVPCDSTFEEVEAVAVHVLANVVERHELQHAAHGQDAAIRLWPDADSKAARTSSSELAAALAEIARGETPRLSLAQALSIPASKRRLPVGMVADALKDGLAASPNETADTLMELPLEQLRSRAARLYHAWYGRAVPVFAVEGDSTTGVLVNAGR